MKRITAIFLMLMLIFGLAACSTESGQSDAETSSDTTREEVQKWPDSLGSIFNTAAEVGVFNFETHTVLLTYLSSQIRDKG